MRGQPVLGALALLAQACGPPGAPASPGGRKAQVVSSGCEGLPSIEPGTISGTTAGMPSASTSRCGAGALGPEAVHTFSLQAPARVRLELETRDHDGALHLREGCGQEGREIACNEDAGNTQRSLLWSHLDAGVYRVVVDGSGRKDAGEYTLQFDVAADGADPDPNSSCAAAEPLPGGAEFVVTTFFAADDLQTACAASPGGPDVFYALDIEEKSIVTASVVASDYSFPVLALASGCEGPWSCGTGALVTRAGPGTQVIAIDSLGGDLMGSVTLSVSVQPLAVIEAACSAAPALVPGERADGTTTGPDLFRAGCGSGAQGPEAVYLLEIEERSRVVVHLNSPGRDGVLHIRSDCTDPGSEVACNDDHGQKDVSEVDLELDAGAYHVFADGRDAGPFSLVARIHDTP